VQSDKQIDLLHEAVVPVVVHLAVLKLTYPLMLIEVMPLPVALTLLALIATLTKE
jgi:hypothetical protein